MEGIEETILQQKPPDLQEEWKKIFSMRKCGPDFIQHKPKH